MEPNPKILSLDLGTTFGWAYGSANEEGEPKILEHGWVSLESPDFKRQQKLYTFQNWIKHKLTQKTRFADCSVVYEEVMFHRGIRSAHLFGSFKGIVAVECMRKGIHPFGVNVPTIRKYMGLKKGDGKGAMIKAVHARGYQDIDNHNEADAVALCLYALEERRLGDGKKTRASRF